MTETTVKTRKPTIELRNIKHVAFASQETNCYEASLLVDGVYWGVVSNEGHGGPDRFDSNVGRNWDDIRALDERIKATWPQCDIGYMYGEPEGQRFMDTSLEIICGDIVNAHVTAQVYRRALQRDLKAKLVFIKPTGPEVYTVPLKQKGKVWPVEQVAEAMLKRQPGITILNGMAFEDALALYTKGA